MRHNIHNVDRRRIVRSIVVFFASTVVIAFPLADQFRLAPVRCASNERLNLELVTLLFITPAAQATVNWAIRFFARGNELGRRESLEYTSAELGLSGANISIIGLVLQFWGPHDYNTFVQNTWIKLFSGFSILSHIFFTWDAIRLADEPIRVANGTPAPPSVMTQMVRVTDGISGAWLVFNAIFHTIRWGLGEALIPLNMTNLSEFCLGIMRVCVNVTQSREMNSTAEDMSTVWSFIFRLMIRLQDLTMLFTMQRLPYITEVVPPLPTIHDLFLGVGMIFAVSATLFDIITTITDSCDPSTQVQHPRLFQDEEGDGNREENREENEDGGRRNYRFCTLL